MCDRRIKASRSGRASFRKPTRSVPVARSGLNRLSDHQVVELGDSTPPQPQHPDRLLLRPAASSSSMSRLRSRQTLQLSKPGHRDTRLTMFPSRRHHRHSSNHSLRVARCLSQYNRSLVRTHLPSPCLQVTGHCELPYSSLALQNAKESRASSVCPYLRRVVPSPTFGSRDPYNQLIPTLC
jgi:hypothetical protein